mgnify:CR=1 FL=1
MGASYASLSCPFQPCDFCCKQEARFLDHLTDVHGIADHEACYIEHVFAGEKQTCACSSVCTEPVRWGGWKKGYVSRFARGHNARIDSVYLDKARQADFAQKRADGYASGRLRVWNDGATKESDPRVAAMAQKTSATLTSLYESGHASWQTGLTKETDPRVANFAAARKSMLDAGTINVWNDGLTKDVDPRVAGTAVKVSAWMQENDPRRLTPDELCTRIVSCAPSLELITSPADYRNKYQRLDVRCRTCGRVSQKTLMMLMNTPVCFFCHPKESRGQLELFEFVKALVPDVVLSDRNVISPMELDVWVPSKKLGIEFDGLYWHSELFVEDDHQARKLARANEAGITLFRIFEDEWQHRRGIIEGMLRHRLGLVDSRIGARECRIIELTPTARREFFEANHLDGDARARKAWGLVHGDELVAALSVRRPFHAVYAGLVEVSRFACRTGTSVPGALSRLARHARHEESVRLMTYVDGRIGNGHAYEAAGFVRISETPPRFWWTDFVSRIDRFAVRANKERGITQVQAAEIAGVVRIFGCPNAVFVLE